MKFNELHLVTDRCPRIYNSGSNHGPRNGGVQLVDVDETCTRCNRVGEIDWEHRLIACDDQKKINTNLLDFDAGDRTSKATPGGGGLTPEPPNCVSL